MKARFLIYLLWVFAWSGCSNPGVHPEKEEQDHSHGAGSIPYTALSDSCEYFAEIEPMVKGRSSVANIHITRLSTYRPFSEGVMTVNLFREGRLEGTGSTDKPRIPGIFPVTFTASEAGNVSLQFTFKGEGVTDSVTIPLAQVYEDEHAAAHAPESESQAGAVKFTKEMAWKTDFRVMEIIPRMLFNTLKVSGELMLPPAESETVNATGDGILVYKHDDLVPGARVSKGSVLFTLTGRGLTTRNMDANIRSLKNQYETSRASYEREIALVKENIVSLKQFNETSSRFRNDSIRYFTVQRGLSGDAMNVESPVTGYIQQLYQPNGAFVNEGTPLVSLGNSQKMILRADLPQQHWKELPSITSASFRLAGSSHIYDISDMGGRLVAKGSVVTSDNPFISVVFELVNNGVLIAGAFAEVFLRASPMPGIIAVPASALLEDQGSHYVYVQVGGESFVRREVSPGFSTGDNITINSGLYAGEKVVTRGALFIKAASRMTGAPSHGHEH